MNSNLNVAELERKINGLPADPLVGSYTGLGTETGFLAYRGRRPWTWVKRLLNPWNYWKLFRRIRATYPRRARVLLMLLLLQFHPQWAYKLSLGLFPDKDRRLPKTSNPWDDFQIDWDRSSELPQLDAVTVIQIGTSFDRSLVDELPGPIYAVNWRGKLDRQDVVYTTSDSSLLKWLVANEMFPIWVLEINWFDTHGNYITGHDGTELGDYLSQLNDPRIKRVSLYHKGGPQRGGGMPATPGLGTVVALGFIAKSIEVYGWDFYLDFEPAQSSYWKCFFKAFVNFKEELGARFIERAIYNWHYCYRFSQLPNFKNHGYLGGLEKHHRINDRLDKIFYKLPIVAT